MIVSTDSSWTWFHLMTPFHTSGVCALSFPRCKNTCLGFLLFSFLRGCREGRNASVFHPPAPPILEPPPSVAGPAGGRKKQKVGQGAPPASIVSHHLAQPEPMEVLQAFSAPIAKPAAPKRGPQGKKGKKGRGVGPALRLRLVIFQEYCRNLT
jgi:hypothetical protein